MDIDIKQIQETKAFYCLECGKCTGACPVAVQTDSFSPRRITGSLVHNSHPDAFAKDNIFACLTCQRCDEICPSEVHIIDLIRVIRQNLEPEKRQETCSHGGILDAISRIMTAQNLNQNRLDWLDKNLKTSQSGDWLYFTGCLPYFDALFAEMEIDSINIARSTLKILNHFDIKPQVMANEKCCGHDMYWNGDQETFELLAKSNLEQIENSGAKNIVTSCPECYRTLKQEYPRYFGRQNYEVYHISELLTDKLNGEKIPAQASKKATFQDPCRLGRHMGIYDAPREVLHHVDDLELVEMAHNRKRGICCGVSGWKNCSQISKKIQVNRLKEAQATGADYMITSCAKCKIHFTCAMRDEKVASEVQLEIKDLTEVVADNLN